MAALGRGQGGFLLICTPGKRKAEENLGNLGTIARYNISRPADEVEPASTAPQPMAFDDWPGPQFDPRQPETFATYLKAHREWMLRLVERQFGRRPQEAK